MGEVDVLIGIMVNRSTRQDKERKEKELWQVDRGFHQTIVRVSYSFTVVTQFDSVYLPCVVYGVPPNSRSQRICQVVRQYFKQHCLYLIPGYPGTWYLVAGYSIVHIPHSTCSYRYLNSLNPRQTFISSPMIDLCCFNLSSIFLYLYLL